MQGPPANKYLRFPTPATNTAHFSVVFPARFFTSRPSLNFGIRKDSQNFCRMTNLEIDFFSSSALARNRPFPSVVSQYNLGSNAFNRLRRSRLMVSGMVSLGDYPLIVATIASPTPVLPLVGSMIVARVQHSLSLRHPQSSKVPRGSFTLRQG